MRMELFVFLNLLFNNIIEDNGYLVNNSPDFTKSRWYQRGVGFSAVCLHQLYNIILKYFFNQNFFLKY